MKTKNILVTVPEGWSWRDCVKCAAAGYMLCGAEETCPMAAALPAVEQMDGDIYDGDCRVYAVKP